MFLFGMGGRSKLKHISNFAITYNCDSKCKICNIWKIKEHDRRELTGDYVSDFFRKNFELLKDLRSIQVTGGEPFLHKDLLNILSIIHTHIPNCFIWIPTNGLNPDKITSTLRGFMEKIPYQDIGISLSIDGIGEIHDEQRGYKGSYKKAIETLSQLCKIRVSHPRFRISIGMTLTPLNCGEILHVYNLSQLYKVGFSVRPVNFSEIYYKNNASNSNDLRDNWRRDIIQIARDEKKKEGLIKSLTKIYYLQGVINYIRNPSFRRLSCTAAKNSIFIDPYGDVYPCIMMNKRMGNIKENKLDVIMNSKIALGIREEIKKLNCPKCWVECEVFREISQDRQGLFWTALKAILKPDTCGLA
jgi:MoaA/NifB/PqqE/SkfB family radical SAM enzyme